MKLLEIVQNLKSRTEKKCKMQYEAEGTILQFYLDYEMKIFYVEFFDNQKFRITISCNSFNSVTEVFDYLLHNEAVQKNKIDYKVLNYHII